MRLLNGAALRARLEAEPPLIEGMIDPELQVQMDGVDFTLRELSAFDGDAGAIDFDNSERQTANTVSIEPDDAGWWRLDQGQYWVVYNEIVNVPIDVFAIARTRSSLLRSGAEIISAVWDSGYSGRSGSLLVVHHPAGIRFKKDARVLQLLFMELDGPAEKGYEGAYQGENK